MAPHVRAAEADRIVPALAAQDSPPPTDAAPDARAKQPAATTPDLEDRPLSDRIRALVGRLAAIRSGAVVDKAFYDDLSGQGD